MYCFQVQQEVNTPRLLYAAPELHLAPRMRTAHAPNKGHTLRKLQLPAYALASSTRQTLPMLQHNACMYRHAEALSEVKPGSYRHGTRCALPT